MSLLVKSCCGCYSPALMTIGGGVAFESYNFSPGCSHSDAIVVTSDDDPELWEYDAENSLLEELCGGPIGAKLVKSGVGTFDWEVFVLDESDATLARYELVHVWRPNCVNKFKLVECDETCDTVVWQPYMCLYPFVPMCPETGVRSVLFTSTFAGFDETDFTGLLPGGCTFPRPLLVNPTFQYEGLTPGPAPCINTCSWPAISGDTLTLDCGGDEYIVGASASVCLDIFNRRVFVGFVLGLSGPGGSVSLSQGFYGPDGVLSGVIPIFDTLDGTTLNEHVFDLVGFEFNINGQDCPSTCTGGSRWILRRAECEDSDVYMYSWELFDNDCDGQCFTASCVPSIPEVPELPLVPVDDATATTSGLIDFLPADPEDVQEEELVNGNCLCQEEYEPVTCCSGTSTWTIAKQFCFTEGDIDRFIYYWVPLSDSCGGPCVDGLATCIAQPPASPVLSTSPVPADEELDALVDVENSNGVCNCDEEYVPPECECDCDSLSADKTFDLAGFSGGETMYNGTYTLIKDFFDCEFVDCCWYGSDDDFEVNAILSWSGGVWTLSIDGGVAIYELAADACEDPIVLNKTAGGGSWPATITVTTSP